MTVLCYADETCFTDSKIIKLSHKIVRINHIVSLYANAANIYKFITYFNYELHTLPSMFRSL